MVDIGGKYSCLLLIEVTTPAKALAKSLPYRLQLHHFTPTPENLKMVAGHNDVMIAEW